MNDEPNGAGSRPAEEASPSPESAGHANSADGGFDLRGKVDQMGAILAKGLDLAEASVGLGVTIVSRIGTVAQQQVLERAAAAMRQEAGAAAATAAQPMPEAQEPPQPRSPMAEPAVFYITNRLPLAPGGAVKVSFSINNDSLIAPKKVSLQVEDFRGEITGTELAADRFSVKPATRTIAPVDFEKFVLHGTVPAETPPDVYVGSIRVASDDELRIPVRVTVSL